MKLSISGNINSYYVQTLCMIFFPGEKFSPTEELTEDTAKLDLKIARLDNGCYARKKIKIYNAVFFSGNSFA